MKPLIPFFPPDMFEADRRIIYSQVYEAGMTNQFILREKVAELESRLKKATGAADAVAVHSGTGAVSLALRAVGVGPGDEVITQGYCCQPVASEVIHLGARPVFVDIDPQTLVMDANKIERKITPRTKAILPAHLFSSLVDMPKVMGIARAYGIKVVEDACVQQGARLDGKPAGLLGDIGTWSFFQMKVMGGCGEGGMVLTDDSALADKCRMLRNHGQQARFNHKVIGVNSRMDDLFAGYLLHRLKTFEEVLERRRAIAAYYGARFEVLKAFVGLPDPGSGESCFYMYTIYTPQRDRLQKFLFSKGVATHIYYPIPLPSQRAFSDYARDLAELEHCTRVGKESLSLPIYPSLTKENMEFIADCVVEYFAS